MQNNPLFTPDELQLSKFRFYSVGVVAENKALSSNVIEVTPIEELSMLDGEVRGTEVMVSAKGVDGSGQSYQTNVKTGNTIQATWLKTSCANRLTSPDVRTGAKVMIYQFGDADKYYWTTWMDDVKLRKLETVIWGISATQNESAQPSADNMYYFEVSSHTKAVTFHTSQANGEPWGYDVQFDLAKGRWVIRDTAGNYIKLDSAARSLTMQNVDGSKVDLTKGIGTFFTPEEINLETKKLTIQATEMTTKVESNTLTAQTNLVKGGNTTVEGEAFVVTTSSISLG